MRAKKRQISKHLEEPKLLLLQKWAKYNYCIGTIAFEWEVTLSLSCNIRSSWRECHSFIHSFTKYACVKGPPYVKHSAGCCSGSMKQQGALRVYKLVDEAIWHTQTCKRKTQWGKKRVLKSTWEVREGFPEEKRIQDLMDNQESVWQIRATERRRAWDRNQVVIAFQGSWGAGAKKRPGKKLMLFL